MSGKQQSASAKQRAGTTNSPLSSDVSEPSSSSPSANSQASSGSSSKPANEVSSQQYWAKKDKEDKEKRRRERREPRTPEPPLPTLFRSPIVPTQDELHCARKESHQLGVYCSECRAIRMPWGNQVPFVEGQTIGAEGTILDGVHLQNSVSIAVVSVMAFLSLNHQVTESIVGLAAMLERHPAAAEAGHRVAHLVEALVYDAEHPDTADEQEIQAPLRQVSPWYIILNSILEQPWMTLAQFHERIASQGQDRHLPGQPASYVNANMQTLIVPPRARTPPASSYPPSSGNGGGDNRGGDNRGDRSGSDSNRDNDNRGGAGGARENDRDSDAGDFGNGGGRSRGGKSVRTYGSGASQQQRSSSTRAHERRHRADDGDEADLIFQSREIPVGTKAQAPAARGQWAIYEGTDTKPAVRGQPDPSKLVMIRQDTNNKDKFDVRIYPHMQGFNWNDQLDISALNKARDQWMRRTRMNALDQPFPWTETENGFLKTVVERELALPGTNADKLNWEKIAKDINGHFDGVKQEIGTKLARTSKLNQDGTIAYHRKTSEKLKKDQVGNGGRTKNECKNQAMKFGDIKKLLKDSLPDNKRKHESDGEEAEDEEEVEQEMEGHTPKKRRGDRSSSKAIH